MAEKKCDMLIQCGKAAWTETHYLPSTVDMNTALGTLVNLTGPRSYLFPLETTFQEVRVSDISIAGDSTVATEGLGGYGILSIHADNQGTALLCRATMGTLHRSQLWLRGLPDDWVFWSPERDQMYWTDDLGKWADAFTDRLKASGFGAMVKLKAGETKNSGGTVDSFAVDNLKSFPLLTPTARSTLVLSTMPSVGMTAGSLVVIKGARGGARAINGTWPLVTDPNAGNAFTIPVVWDNVVNFEEADISKARIYPAVFEFRAYTSFSKRFIRTKKYGRDQALPRGRARTRR